MIIIWIPFAAIAIVLFAVPLAVRAIAGRVRRRRTGKAIAAALAYGASSSHPVMPPGYRDPIAQVLARGECPWCARFGFSSTPSDCTCGEPCGDITCKHAPVRRDGVA